MFPSIVLYCTLVLAPFSQYWEDSDVVKAMKGHVGEITLVQNEGRAPGSDGEKAVAAYIREIFIQKGIDVISGLEGDVFGIVRRQGDTLSSRNVIGYLPGYDPALKNRFIVIGARMDNLGVNHLTIDGVPSTQIYTGANGNASGISMMLELSGMLSRNSMMLRRSVILVAFGSSTHSFSGAWHFLNHTFAADADKIDAMVNLDVLGVDREGFQAFCCGNEDLNMMISEVSSSLQPIKPSIAATEPYPSDHQVFYAAEIPSITFTSGRYIEHDTPRDTQSILDYDFMERELEYIYNFCLSLANAPEGVPAFYETVSSRAENKGAEDVFPWSDCEIPPTFYHNADPGFFLKKWVYPYLKYPESCIRDGIQGRVMVEFTIMKDGSVGNVHVVRGVDPLLDEAAVKVVAASPKWKAAVRHGKKVNSSMTIPVEFRLKRKK